jgi:hypothetical protein
MTIIPATLKVKVGGWRPDTCCGKNMRPYLKSKVKTKTGGLAQVVEYLPSKHEALSLIVELQKKEEKEGRREGGKER